MGNSVSTEDSMKKCDVLEEQLKIWLPGWKKKQENSINQLVVQLVVWGPVVWIPGIPL